MNFLCSENSGTKYALEPGYSYKVGKHNAQIKLVEDTSVSKVHAEISCNSNGDVSIKDVGSKYGTYVGERAVVSSENHSQELRLDNDQTKILKNGERVKFGLQSSLFKLKKKKLVICTSCLTHNENTIVKNSITKLGTQVALFKESWDPQTTHLVAKEGKLTIKMANALANCIPIITSEYIKDFINCIKTVQKLPDPKDYVPSLKETTLNINHISLAPNIQRKTVFQGMTFTFSNSSKKAKYQAAISYAGGSSKLYDGTCNPIEFTNSDNILVATSADETLQTEWQKTIEILQSKKLYPIHESHIPLAILTGSCSVYCNPKKEVKLFNSSQNTASSRHHATIVSDSEHMSESLMTSRSSKSIKSQNTKVIHETVGTISTLGTKVSPPSTSKTLLENNSNVANFSIGSFPREEERSQATPNVIHETVMSSATASSSKSLVGNESEVEKSMSITDDSFGGSLPPKERTDFRRPKTPLEFLSKTPRASMNKSQLKPTMEIVTQSHPNKQLDDDDLFNFEEEEESGDKDKTKSKRKRSASTECMEATPSHSKRTKVQTTTFAVTSADEPEKTKKEWQSNPGKFLSKFSALSSPKSLSSIDSAATSNKIVVVDEEISKSFMTLEVRPLVLVKKSNSSLPSDISSNNASSFSRNNNKKNVKTFKKQIIAKPNRPSIPCTISVTSSVANLGTLENAMEITNAQVEENQVAGNSNQEIRAPPSRRPRNSDQEEDIWNFEDSPEQRPASRKRKR